MDDSQPPGIITGKTKEEQSVSDKREAFKYAPDFFKDSVDQYGTLVKSELEKKVVVSLEIKCLHPVGVDITWNISHLPKNVLVKNYYWLIDGSRKGPYLSPHINRATVENVELGKNAVIQIVAVCEEKIIHAEERTAGTAYQYEITSTPLTIHYDKLVLHPEDLCVLNVHSNRAELCWSKGISRLHHVHGTSYRVMWWKTEDDEGGDVHNTETTDCNVRLGNLEEETKYTVLVESRGKVNYMNSDGQEVAVDVSAASIPVTFVTSQLCQPPRNFKAVHVTSEKIQLKWDFPPPESDGSKALGLKVFVMTKEGEKEVTVACQELLPDRMSSTIRNLKPETTYQLHMVLITEKYLKKSSKNSGQINQLKWTQITKDEELLPYTSIRVTTLPSARPTDLRCTKVTSTTVHLRWNFPAKKGIKLLSFSAVCKSVFQIPSKDGKKEHETKLVQSLDCRPEEYAVVFQNLMPCSTYSFQIIAQSSLSGFSFPETPNKVTELECEPLEVRVPAHIKPTELLLSSFSPYHVDLKWWKPELALSLPNSDDVANCCHLLRSELLAYQLFVNDRLQSTLAPHSTSTTLTCTPNKDINVSLGCVVTSNRRVAVEVCRRWTKFNKKRSSILKDISDYDVIRSRQLHLRLPQPVTGNVISVEATFLPNQGTKDANYPDGSKDGETANGTLKVLWRLPDFGVAEEQGIMGYDISWMCNKDGRENNTRVHSNASSCLIPVYHDSCVVDVSVSAIKEDGVWEDLSSPSIQILIPGPPDPPTLTCKEVTSKHIQLEWSEPRLHGDVKVAGFQVYMNNKPVGNVLTSETFQAIMPCQPLKTYVLNVAAVADDAISSHSRLQEPVIIQTPEATQKNPSLFEIIDNSARGTTKSHIWKSHTRGKLMPETVSVVVDRVTNHCVTVSWTIPYPGSSSDVYQFKVCWSSVAKPKELDVLLKGDATQFTIRNCVAGTSIFLVIYGLNRQGDTICRSQQLTVQTSAPIATPVIVMQESNFEGCTITWQKPEQFGGARLNGYLLTINQETINQQERLSLPVDTLSYTLRNGKMCQKYTFILKALCCIQEFSSKESDPVSIMWPGVVTPDLRRASTSKVNSIGVKWEEPVTTGGAIVSKLKVLCMVDRCAPDTTDSTLPEAKNPSLNKATPFLNPHCQSVEFTSLAPRTKHLLYLDIHLKGLDRPIRSRALVAEVARRPLTPTLRCSVPTLVERKQLDTEACQLINSQDRILQSLYDIDNHLDVSLHHQIKDEILARKRLSHFASLTVVESKLRKCLERIAEHTGTVSVHLSWDLTKDDGDATISGYRILVNDKPHGLVLHSHVTDTTIQLSAYNGKHRIILVAVTDHPVGDSDPSDMVLVDTTPFLPFTHRCLHNVHSAGSRFPTAGCCSYLETYKEEIATQRMLVGFGRSTKSSRRIPPPSVMVYDLYHKTTSLLVPTKLSNKRPTLILFWNHWCLASQNAMSFFVQYAKGRTSWLTCSAACCCGRVPLEPHYSDLAKMILSRGWKTSDAVRHTCCCQEVSGGDEERTVYSPAVPDMFGITSVPTLVLVHPQGYLVWRGLLPATQLEDFNILLDEKIHECCRTSLKKQSRPAESNQYGTSRNRSRSSGFIVEETSSFLPRRQGCRSHQPEEEGKLLTINRRPYSSGGFQRGSEMAASIRRQRPKSSLHL
ncbi:uncharacterized protein [Apostichopus japonicus]|uniref:uncharacterized protein isoform X2 n=1 Tax=Stichopus japonicus TaxID=307972 RepID=UPI003AB5C1B3